jgi:hypothetical protein
MDPELANIRLGRKSLQAYFGLFVSDEERQFGDIDFCLNVQKHFYFIF